MSNSHQHRWKLDKNLIPLKAHYFLQGAGLGAIWPFLPVLGRQLGITPFSIGLIFGIATLFILIAKPLAKNYSNQKTIFIISTFLVTVSLLSFTIFPQPNIDATRPVEFECAEGTNYIKQCSDNNYRNSNSNAVDAANVNVKKTNLWHEPLVCPTLEQRGWIESAGSSKENSSLKYIPDYIENDQLRYATLLAQIANFSTAATTQKKKTRLKRAPIEIPDKSTAQKISSTLAAAGKTAANVKNDGQGGQDKDTSFTRCYVSCEAIDFQHLLHFCANFIGTKNVSAELCTELNRQKTHGTIGEETQRATHFLHFETTVKITKTLVAENCLHLPLDEISFQTIQSISVDEYKNLTMVKNTSTTTYEPDQLPFEQFMCLPNKTVFKNCFANCPKNSFGLHLNSYLEVYSPIEHELFSTHVRFWFYVILVVLGVGALGIVNSINDSVCTNLVYENPDKFNLQKLWAVGGFGLFCLFSGYFIDRVSEGKIAKDYAPCFFLIMGLLTLDFVISFRLEIKPPAKFQTLWKDSLAVFRDPRITLFTIDCLIMGIICGVHTMYLLWYIEELNEKNGCTAASNWIRTLQGFLVSVRCISEICFFRASGWLLNKFGYFNCLTLVFVLSSVQYAMYCLLQNPWSFAPLEIFQGIIYSIFFSTMINYGSVAVSLSGRQNTPRVKQFFSIAFGIIGFSTGAIFGGYLFDENGGQMVFATIAVSCLVLSFIHSGFVFVLNKKINYGHAIPTGNNSVNTSTNEQKLKRISRSDSQEFHFDFESDIE